MKALDIFRHNVPIAKVAAIGVLTFAIDWSIRWALGEVDSHRRVSETLGEYLAIVVNIHIPAAVAYLTWIFFPRSALAAWFAALFLALTLTNALIFFATGLLVARYVHHVPFVQLKPLIWASAFVAPLALICYIRLLPWKCLECGARGLLVSDAHDLEVVRAKCFRCGGRFFRKSGDCRWTPGTPPTFEEPIPAPESLVFPGVDGVLLRAAKRGRPEVDQGSGALRFRHDQRWSYLFIPLLIAMPVLFCGCLVIQLYRPRGPWDGFWALACLLALATSAFAAMFWDFKRFALIVTNDGLDCRSPWKHRRFLRWNDIQSVSYTKETHLAPKFFTIHASDGWKFRVSIFVPGISEFLAQCERHLPREALVNAWTGFVRLGRACLKPVETAAAAEAIAAE